MDSHDDELISNHKATLADHEKRIRDLERVSAERTVKLLNFDEKFGAILKGIDQVTTKVDEMKDNFDSRLLEMEARINAKIQNLAAEVNDRIKPLEDADGEKWRKFVWLIIGALVAGAVGYMIGSIKGDHQ